MTTAEQTREPERVLRLVPAPERDHDDADDRPAPLPRRPELSFDDAA